MSRMADMQGFIDLSQSARAEDLPGLMQGIAREMGFDHFALAYRTGLVPGPDIGADARHAGWLVVSDWPEAWLEVYAHEGLAEHDPIILAMRGGSPAFTWDALPGLMPLDQAQRNVLERARKSGLINGLAIPANAMGELTASCVFAIAPGREMPTENIGMAMLVGAFAFQAQRLLVGSHDAPVKAPEALTERQLECIVLVARGKTDWEIAQILGLSETTVKWHLNEAKRRYAVSKRVQAVLRAVFDGQVPLAELIV